MVDAFRAKRVFQRARTEDEIRALGVVLYHLGLSLRDASLVLTAFQGRSHEAVREWYARAKGLFQVQPRSRRARAVDETKVKVQGRWLYLWAAVDVDTWEVLGTWVSQGRSGFEALRFLRTVLALCEGAPTVYVDGAPWYPLAFRRLGVPWEHRTFGPRNPIEGWFGVLKQRIKRFYKRWPHNADLTKADEWVRSFVALYHVRRSLS